MWKYKNKNIVAIPEDFIGFVYLITNKLDSRIYIGKKLFNSTRRSKIGVREKAATKTRKKYKINIKDSGWQDYHSSCTELQNDIKTLGKENFTFKILELCKTKAELTYKEVKTQFEFNVLETNSYNGNILSRFFKPKTIINE